MGQAGSAPPESPADQRGHRRIAALVALALVLGLAWGVSRLSDLRVAPGEWTPAAWADGQASMQVNKALGTMPGQAVVDRWSAAVRYRAFGDLGPKVLEGCPGWLFYRDGLRAVPGHAGAYAARQRLMRHWAQAWQAKGVPLLVLTVPDKSRMATAHLCGLRMAPPLDARWNDWQQALAAAHLATVDLRPALQQVDDAYYRTDVHMTQAGAQAAAVRAAEQGVALLGGRGTQQFVQTDAAAPEPRMGDLIVLAGLEHAPDGWRPPMETTVAQTIAPVRSEGLLDDSAPVQVLLLGDSNGLRSGFAERLGRQLGREVWNLSQDGGYFSGAMLDALARGDKLPRSLRLVVWQFSELSLSLPLTDAEKRALKAIE